MMLLVAALALQTGQNGRFALPTSKIWQVETFVTANENNAGFAITVDPSSGRVPVFQGLIGDLSSSTGYSDLEVKVGSVWKRIHFYEALDPGYPLRSGRYRVFTGGGSQFPESSYKSFINGYWALTTTPATPYPWMDEYPAADRLWEFDEGVNGGQFTIEGTKYILKYASGVLYKKAPNGQFIHYLDFSKSPPSKVGFRLPEGTYTIQEWVGGNGGNGSELAIVGGYISRA